MSISCVVCNYAITEPLCASCVINEVKVWMYDQTIKTKVLIIINKKLRTILRRVESLDYVISPFEEKYDSILKCIKCKNGVYLMCFYCVSNQASQIVKSNLKNKMLIENFEESFNTSLYGYESDSKLYDVESIPNM
ncbi:MAG: hypothetical protein AABW89_05790 [Nanoarchaeota archaeon]